MKQQSHRQRAKEKEPQLQPEVGAARVYVELEWTESEWFQVWLNLARAGQELNRN